MDFTLINSINRNNINLYLPPINFINRNNMGFYNILCKGETDK